MPGTILGLKERMWGVWRPLGIPLSQPYLSNHGWPL